jgi:mannose-6-phosphate isomerase-like protein (cupin superfamily)
MIDCKVSGKDTGGAMCVLEVNNSGWPRHVNRDQDEWIYVVDGEVDLEISKKRFHLGTGESMLIPRNIEHAWAPVSSPAKVINTYQPAGKIEGFFQVLAKFKGLPTREQSVEKSYSAEQVDALKQVFEAHGMVVTGPPLGV